VVRARRQGAHFLQPEREKMLAAEELKVCSGDDFSQKKLFGQKLRYDEKFPVLDWRKPFGPMTNCTFIRDTIFLSFLLT